MSTPIVRFAPSPTGPLHLGSALTAVANRAFAHSTGGRMILRIDDTDAARSEEHWVEQILDGLDWLGVGWDGEPVRQSARRELYELHLRSLVESGAAYPCFCDESRLARLREQQEAAGEPPRYDGLCRKLDADLARERASSEPHVLRLRVDDEDHAFDDLVRGRIAAPAGSFGDFVLRRSDGDCTYLFCSVVDDLDLHVTHVLRGEDHLPNTPRQIAILRALGAPAPHYAHLALVRNTDGAKLAKRDPLGTLEQLIDAGFLPETIRRYAAELLGQGAVDPLQVPPGSFRVDRIPTGAPKIDAARLASLGQEDVGRMDPSALAAALGEQSVTTTSDELALLGELAGQSSTLGEVVGGLEAVRREPDLGSWSPEPELAGVLEAARRALSSANGDWAHTLTDAVRTWAGEQGLTGPGPALKTVRMALTGTTRGPRLDAVLQALGRDEAARRLGAE